MKTIFQSTKSVTKFYRALFALAGWIALPNLSPAATDSVRFQVVQLPSTGDANSSTLAVQVADFNGDGNADVALPLDAPDLVLVYYGDGHGGFSAGQGFGAGSYPHAMVVGDFNEDGKVDVAVAATSGEDGVEVLLNNGAGGFLSPVFFRAGEFLTGLAVGDFDRDGHQDIAAPGGRSQHLTVLRGDGHGDFKKSGVFDVGIATSLAIGDYNMDGIPDLAAVGSLQLLILQGDGTGSFAGVHTYPLPGDGAGIVTADFNHDNRLDVAVSEINGDPTVVFLGNGDGSFTAGAQVQAPDAQGLAAPDLNGDGNLDLAVPTYSTGSVMIALGRGNGNFRRGHVIEFARHTAPIAAAVGDFNADGRQDMVMANYTGGGATVLLNLPR